jgi:hypothetical protein
VTGIVKAVFKTILTVVLVFVTLNIFTVVVDTMLVNSRISSLAPVIALEGSNHNCIPDATSPMFQEQLEKVIENSVVAVEIKSNLTESYTDKYGVTHPALTYQNAGDYGEIGTLVIEIRMQPTKVYMNPADHTGTGTTKQLRQLDKTTTEYILHYDYSIPFMRYTR